MHYFTGVSDGLQQSSWLLPGSVYWGMEMASLEGLDKYSSTTRRTASGKIYRSSFPREG